MATATKQIEQESFFFTSSIADDVWHEKANSEAFEWWYFDALSEDGRDAVVIIFLDNFIFSPRYNKISQKRKGFFKKVKSRLSGKGADSVQNLFPAIAFTYYRDGKPKYRAINEFAPAEFSASDETPRCQIGNNFFRLESAPYGSGYVLSINAKLRKNRNLEAHFEWLSVESNFLPDKPINLDNAHNWNLAVSRADVTGRISVSEDEGKNLDTIHFRGTGYHDHNIDNRWLPETVSDWQWGRAHFSDATAVFYRYKENGGMYSTTKLLTITDGVLLERDAAIEEQNFSRNKFGIKYARLLRFISDDNVRLEVLQKKIIDSSFFYLRFFSEMTLTQADGTTRKTTGITEYLAPKVLKYRWLDWLTNMRIGRKGKGAFLP
jgi:carotenoid 1,2-hydratase